MSHFAVDHFVLTNAMLVHRLKFHLILKKLNMSQYNIDIDKVYVIQ